MNWKDVLNVLDKRLVRYMPASGVEQKNGYATGYVLKNGRQLAAETTSDGQRTNVWIEDVGPPAVPSHFQLYKEDKTRISSLSSVAPKLSGPGYGKPSARAYKIVITSLPELEALLNWYGDEQSTPKLDEKEIDVEMANEEQEGTTMSLNKILYGPPGTGKTYKTAQLAVEICDGVTPPFDRNELMARYEALRQEGRISFVTFHQSYGYEDFVEGLRPEMNEGQVSYRVRPGVFRDVCDTARRNTLVRPGLSGKPLKERTVFKMSLGAAGTAEGRQAFQASIENGIVLLGWGGNVDFSDCKNQDEILKRAKESGVFEKPESDARYVGVLKDELQLGDIVIASHGNSSFQAIGEVTGAYEYLEAPLAGRFHQKRNVRWLAVYEGKRSVEEIFNRNFTMSSLYKLDPGGLNYEALENLLKERQAATNLPFVLVIDEINRANISKVFGELITLLEADKREGRVNALTIKLPYSGDEFCVPANLHLIGTMNTADRSIALLDTALRRRFEFEELQPDDSVLPEEPIEGVELRRLLRAINERVEYLYDRDHTIGHAYFIGVSSIAELDSVFRRKVIPLLQEYFYENWAKVRAVLNDSAGDFIETQTDVPKGLEAIVDGYDPKPRYRVRSSHFPQNAFIKIYQDV